MKSLWRKVTAAAVALVCAVSLAACGSGQRLMMGTGGTAGTYYAYGGVLAQYMTQYAKVKVTAVSTDASKANIESIHDGDYQLGFSQSDVMQYAWDGTQAFKSEGKMQDFRVLGALYPETVQLITMDPKITKVSQLKGKSVSIGAPGSGSYFNAMDVLNAAGLSIHDIKPQYQSFEDSKEALKDGKIKAAFIVAGAPTTAITELATTNGVTLIPIEGSFRDKLLKKDSYYTKYTIPAKTYPGQNHDIETITVKSVIIVSKKLSNDTVYKLTASIFDHKKEIAKENAKGELLSLKEATEGIQTPFHEGAAKYYREHNITVKAQK